MVSEKIDGTNASILIQTEAEAITENSVPLPDHYIAQEDDLLLLAGSRSRWLSIHDDNYGFANWVKDNAEELVKLGPGHHFGEWWGKGINRNYGLSERRFSLFNVEKWNLPSSRPAICSVVPVLYRGPFRTSIIDACVSGLAVEGSLAAPGFMEPEGVVIYHTAGNLLFKKTVKGDELHKSQDSHVRAEPKPPRPKADPSKGGRRKSDVIISFPDRRKK